MTNKDLKDELAGLFSDLTDLGGAVKDSPPVPEPASIDVYHAWMDHLPIGLCRAALALDGKLLMTNQAFRRMFALESEEALQALTLADLFVNEADLKKLINDLVATERSIGLQCRLRKQNGATILCAINAASDSDLLYFDGAIEDVTDRKQAEEQAELWNLRYALATAHWRQVVYDCDTQGGVMLWGGGVNQVLGYSAAQLYGGLTQWSERVHPDDRWTLLGKQEKAEQSCSDYAIEYRFRHQQGHYIWLLDRGFFIADAGGRAARRVGMLQDITARKSAGEAITPSSA